MAQSTFKIYNNVVSFGCMCSLALHLKKLGLRSSSGYFDWVTSDIEKNIELVENNFEGFFDTKYFKQEFPGYAHLITNTKYRVVYTHVFDPKSTLKKQYQKCRRYVQKKIDNFYKSLNDNCLLIYYSRSEQENNWIKTHQELIKEFCDKHKCDMAFVLNFDIEGPFAFPKFVIPQNNIHKPNGGGVSYPFEHTEELDDFLISHYDIEKRQKNLSFKSKESLIHRIKRRLGAHKKDRLVV